MARLVACIIACAIFFVLGFYASGRADLIESLRRAKERIDSLTSRAIELENQVTITSREVDRLGGLNSELVATADQLAKDNRRLQSDLEGLRAKYRESSQLASEIASGISGATDRAERITKLIEAIRILTNN